MNYISELRTVLDGNLDFYEYELMRYWNDTSIDIRNDWEYQWHNIGFDRISDSDLLRSAYTNTIKSVIDSLVSKLANQKVRPYFNPINGTWKTKKVVKNIQQYFDILFDREDVNKKVSDAFRNACIMGRSYIFINPLNNKIMVLPAHCVATLKSEEKYGEVKHGLVRFLHFPTSSLKDYGIDFSGAQGRCSLYMYFDTDEHVCKIFVNSSLKKTIPYKHDEMPWVTVYYNTPVMGNECTSIVQELDGIQTQIDFINAQISAATQLTPANQTFVIEGSNLNPKDLSNKAGVVYGIKMPPGVNTPPVVSVQQRMFDPQWQQLLEYYVKQAYEIVGISQLSAMSKKPSGLDSGTALATMEDIESDRFETQVTNYIRVFVNLANLIINIVDEDAEVLPSDINVSAIKWKDVKKQKDLFKIQYSAATSLSKDPAEKIKQIVQMTQIGLITPDKVARYLDMPDLEDAYSEASATADGVSQCISRAIEEDDYDIPTWVSYEALSNEITSVQNQLYSALVGNEKDDKDTKKALTSLMKLEENLAQIMESQGFIESEEPEEAVVSESGIAVAPEATSAPSLADTYGDSKANEQEAQAVDVPVNGDTGNVALAE